jgi:hypothetical protein
MSSTITPAGQWRQPGENVTLPSGKTALLRETLPVYALLRSGRISQDELEALQQAANGKLGDPELAVRLIDLLCEIMFIEPKVVAGTEPDVDAGEIAVDWLDQEDQDFVLERAFGGTPSDGFREKHDGAGGGEDGEVLADPPERAARPAKRKPAKSRARQRPS